MESEKYILTVGLEVHAELNTKTKMFCNSKNDPDESRPNSNICPICLGYPGTLPVINKEAVKKILTLGVAVDGKIADFTEFDRKNYFYPDIPKGYQISQYKNPLVSGGELLGIKLTRVHLEEDTAKSTHDQHADLGFKNSDLGIIHKSRILNHESSLLDFNRAGVPLMELVTEPVIHTSEEAVGFAKELQLLLQYLNISGANMEKGEMRVEANVSVSRSDLENSDSKVGPLGTKVEVKNLNSFRVVEKAIKFEMKRQMELLERGERVVQETRGWNETREETFSQRLKESAHDYRYFPDPDLPKLFISEVSDFAPEALRRTMPELPWQKRERYAKLGITDEHAEIYIRDREKGKLFEEVAEVLNDAKSLGIASNYITSDLKILIPASVLREITMMFVSGEISSRGAKDILKIIQENGGDPREIAQHNNLTQESDREVLKKIAEEVFGETPQAPIQFLVGQAMKKSGNRANPVILQELFLDMSDH